MNETVEAGEAQEMSEDGPSGAHLPKVPHFQDHAGLMQFVAECAAMASIYAQQIDTYASIGDIAGAEYATRQLITYTKAIGATFREIRTLRAHMHARALEREGAAAK